MSTGPYYNNASPFAGDYIYPNYPMPQPMPQPWAGAAASGWMTPTSPHRRNVYPQDMSSIVPNTLTGSDAQLWKDLPATLRDIDLIDHNDRSGKHSWLLNTRYGVTWLLLMAKREQNLKFEEIANKLGLNPVWVTSAIYGQQTFDQETAIKLIRLLGFEEQKTGKKMAAQLTCPPMRGTCPMNDPTMLRFHEIIALYAPTFKALISERLGDGVVSAVDNKIFLQVKNAFGQWTSVGAFTTTADGHVLPTQPQLQPYTYGNAYGYGGITGGAGSMDPAAAEARAYYNGQYDTQSPIPAAEHGQQRVRVIIEGAHVPYRPW
jgi:cyanate lyase